MRHSERASDPGPPPPPQSRNEARPSHAPLRTLNTMGEALQQLASSSHTPGSHWMRHATRPWESVHAVSRCAQDAGQRALRYHCPQLT